MYSRRGSRMAFIVVGITVGTLAVFSSVLFISLFFKNRSEKSIPSKLIFTEYQVVSKRSFDQYPTVGYVTIPEIIEKDQFKTTMSEDGSAELISNIGEEEYQCTGTCYCDVNDNYRRSNAITLTRPLYYLLAAATSTAAYSIAKKYFDNECQNRISDDCPLQSILSDVEDCGSVFDRFDESQELANEEIYDDDDIEHVYWCEASCVSPNNQIYDQYSRRGLFDLFEEYIYEDPKDRMKNQKKEQEVIYENERVRCEDEKQAGKISVREEDVIDYVGPIESTFEPITPKKQGFGARLMQAAKNKFKEKILVPFCQMIGRKIVNKMRDDIMNDRTGFTQQAKKTWNYMKERNQYKNDVQGGLFDNDGTCDVQRRGDNNDVKCRKTGSFVRGKWFVAQRGKDGKWRGKGGEFK